MASSCSYRSFTHPTTNERWKALLGAYLVKSGRCKLHFPITGMLSLYSQKVSSTCECESFWRLYVLSVKAGVSSTTTCLRWISGRSLDTRWLAISNVIVDVVPSRWDGWDDRNNALQTYTRSQMKQVIPSKERLPPNPNFLPPFPAIEPRTESKSSHHHSKHTNPRQKASCPFQYTNIIT